MILNPATIGPWDGATPCDCRQTEDIEVQVDTTPGAAYTPQRSFTNGTFYPCNAYDKDGNAVTSITAAGIYSLDGGGWLKLTGGSGSTFTIRAGA